jgi:hypothetical protein
MITIKIGVSERHFDNVDQVDENWINQQINGLKKDKYSVCVRVSIHEEPVYLTLATPDCQTSGGGGRQPNEKEKEVFSLWDKLGLNTSSFHGGNLVSFFKQARRIIR